MGTKPDTIILESVSVCGVSSDFENILKKNEIKKRILVYNTT